MNKDAVNEFKRSITTEQDVFSIFENLDLKKTNRGGYKAKCPFHNDNTPSFHINIKDGILLYHCFGCGESGDIINFISKKHNLDISRDFNKIIHIISDLTNTPIPEPLLSSNDKSKEETEFEYYHKQLLENENLKKHLYKRGIEDLSIFGYDNKTDKYKILSRHHNNYIIINYNPDKEPKYKFPSGFKKHIPFNQYRFNKGDIWLVEGIFDALYLYENHNNNAVALLGTDLQNRTIELLKRYDNIIIALDNDKAGSNGTNKAINKLYQNGFSNIFHLSYNEFKFKDFNEAFQNGKSNEIESLIKNNRRYAYKFLVEEHLKNRLNIKDDLDEIKEIDRFLKEIINYQETIQQSILKYYQEKIGIDIKAQFELYKNQLITHESYQDIKSIITNNNNFNLDNLEEIKRITDGAFSSITTIEIFKTPDIVNLEIPNKIESTLIDGIAYYESALSFIGARTGHRKTSLMINEAINMLNKHKVAFISLEEPFSWVGAKLVVNCYNRFNNNQITLNEFFKNKRKYSANVEKHTNNLYILDKSHYIEDLEKYIIHLHLHYRINIFFIDYLQRISFKNNNMARLNRQEQIKQINTKLLDLAKQNSLYIISGVQLNRSVQKEEDIKTDNAYREAGDIEQDANLLINLWSDKEQNELKYFIAKNRNGKSGLEGILNIKPEFWLLEIDMEMVNNDLSSINGFS
ncbi:MAG: DnaB-like helicase C-terminal domain-containing protein [Bacillota bacterium]